MAESAVDVVVVNHPVVQARLTALRDARSDNPAFRALLTRLSELLVYEALASYPVTPVTVSTPIGPCDGVALTGEPLLVPVLRAGLGMLEAALAVVPEAQVGFVGVARDEETARPHEYLVSLPEDLSERHVYVLDPMLATGGSMVHTLDILARRGATAVTAVCVIGTPEGVAALEDSGHRVRLVTAGIDHGLNEASYIVPGLGDAGDRQFGARNF